MNRRTRRLRTLAAARGGAPVRRPGVALQATDALRRLELSTVDARFDVRGADPRRTTS